MRKQLLDMFRLDLRLLGIFRILVALLVIVDTINRSFDLTVFYTDIGVLPRSTLLEHDWNGWNFSINMVTGSYGGQVFLFGLMILFAVMVMVGYRTKLFLILLYLFIISIQTRNPQIVHSGDAILKLLVFYAIFLPVNARYAIDKFHPSSLPKLGRVLSIATIVYLLQVVFVYVFAAIAKTGIEWADGTAVYYVMNLDMFTKPPAKLLLPFTGLTELLTYGTYYLEKYGFILLFIPFAWKYFRTAGVLLFMSLHVGFFFFMILGNFPWAALIMWFVVLPPMVADVIETKGKQWGLYDRLSAGRNFLREQLQQSTWHLFIPERSYRPLGWIPSIFLGFVFTGIFLWNTDRLDILKSPPFFKSLVRTTATYQGWSMFAPGIFREDGWFVMDAQIKSGAHIDILNDREEVIYEKPVVVSDTYINERWQAYLFNRKSEDDKSFLRAWGSYYCRCWNDKHKNTPQELESFSIYFMEEITPPIGQPNPKANKKTIWNHWCKKEFRDRFD